VRTGYGLVSRCTPAESGLPGASRYYHRRLRGALFSTPSYVPRYPPVSVVFSFFFLFLFTCLFFLRTSEATHARVIHDRPPRARSIISVRFLLRDHDEVCSGERGFRLRGKGATGRPFRPTSREVRSRTRCGSMVAP